MEAKQVQSERRMPAGRTFLAAKKLSTAKEWPLRRVQEIRLPQMANAALSENWLLKELGDIHWQLISRGLEQKTAGFRNAAGERMCAAFVRIRYTIAPLCLFRENDMISFEGYIRRSGTSLYRSGITGRSGGKRIDAMLLSCFSAIGGDNRQISKSAPVSRVNHIPDEGQLPEMYQDLRRVRTRHDGWLESGVYRFDLSDQHLDSIQYTINPFYEVNGVGLLYFAAYPFIADQCTARYFDRQYPELQYSRCFDTVYRDIFYYANCNVEDLVIHHICNVDMSVPGKLKLVTCLARKSDGALMAKVFTVKQLRTNG